MLASEHPASVDRPTAQRSASRHRLVINGRFLTQPVTGVQRYAREVLEGMDALLAEGAVEGLDVEVVAPASLVDAPTYRALRVRRGGRLRGHAWEQLELPRMTGGALLMSLCNSGPLAVRRQVLTIHDAAVFARPQTYSPVFRTWYRALLGQLSQSVLRIITPSAFSRASIASYCGVDGSRIEVIPHGHEHVLRPAAMLPASYEAGAGRPFVLAVSSHSVNKNFAAIAAAMPQVGRELDVVVAGGSNARVFSDGASLPAFVRCLGYVSDGELRALYERALCLIYPSWYEGFGFPPLEAMACGCAVIASNSASLPEVCGEAALYCDPQRPEALAACVRRLIDEPRLRARLQEEGRARAARFSWRESALRHLRCVERLIHV